MTYCTLVSDLKIQRVFFYVYDTKARAGSIWAAQWPRGPTAIVQESSAPHGTLASVGHLHS